MRSGDVDGDIDGSDAERIHASRTRHKCVLLVFAALFFGVQLAHTCFRTNNWPFCSYSLFSFRPGLAVSTLRVIFHGADGSTQTGRAGQLVPLEFFRAQQVLYDVYVRSDDRVRATAVAHVLLDRLNSAPWAGFDETLAAARQPSGVQFVGFDIILQILETGSPSSPRTPPVVVRSQTVFSFREQ